MRLLVPVSLVGLLLCGCGSRVYCQGATCTGDAGLGSSDAGPPCGGQCTGSTPVCDVQRNACVTCGGALGCAGATPVCDEGAANGAGACVVCTPNEGCQGALPRCLVDSTGRSCVECLSNSDCASGKRCDSSLHACRPPFVDDAGTTPDAGGADAGTNDNTWDGGACIPRPPPVTCTAQCNEGFTCVGGSCVLNGGSGPVQVTLRWNTDEDVDLHVIEPVPGGAPCDVYYGNPDGSDCGAMGVLDLDSNAGCNIDGVDIENVIYSPAVTPTPGTWAVRVDHYENCASSTTVVPYEVEVRVGANRMGYCGVFRAGGPGWNASGGANGGIQVMTFQVP